ncbi:MAG: hypothetical protein S0880_34375 [Actinomycetota bacterium]|nr:hypothetical protein [Actinomycetota bacterium]
MEGTSAIGTVYQYTSNMQAVLAEAARVGAAGTDQQRAVTPPQLVNAEPPPLRPQRLLDVQL